MAKAKSPVPEGQHTVSAHLVCKDAPRAIDFYKRAFGATELSRFAGPDGKIMHATLKLGDALFFLADEMPMPEGGKSPASLGGTPVTINFYTPDSDRIFRQAIGAGAKEVMPISDQFWGDHYGVVRDPFGHHWAIAERVEDLTHAEMESRAREFFARMAAQHR
jgi:PhnB protein